MSYASRNEITRRAQLDAQQQKSRLLEEHDNENDNHNDDGCCHDKYDSMTIAGRFENPFKEYRAQTLFEFFLTRLLELWEGRTRGGVPAKEELRALLPIYKPDFELLEKTSLLNGLKDEMRSIKGIPELKNRMTFTWLGQSCSFLQISGVNILTDPLFADYLVNPYIGPKRITPSPCELEELPNPHFVLVSHNHPDHLDVDAVKKLHNSTTWVVPMGLRKFFARRGIHNTIELDWWEKAPLPVPQDPDNLYEVACTPAMHWSGRQLWDSNTTLWCSFLILKNGKPLFYHAGDTGYVEDLFTKIRDKYGAGTRLAMLPCGQYCPQWHQKPRHINPGECVKIMEDLQAKKILGVHWGTFVLSSEHFLEPKIKLDQLARDMGKVNDIFTPQFGKTLVFDLSKEGEQGERASLESVRDGKCTIVE